MAAKHRRINARPSYVSYFRFSASGSDVFPWAGNELERIHFGIAEERIPSHVLRVFRDSTGFTTQEMATIIGVSPRTICRKARGTGNLKTSEADRAIRFTGVVHAAVHSIGDLPKAVRWMRKPNVALRGRSPLALIESEPGTQLVLATLDRIAYGGVI